MTEKGLFILMPFVVKAMERLIEVIDREMVSINAQKLVMPSLVSKQLWETSGLKSHSFQLIVLIDNFSDQQVVGMNREKNSLD